MYKMLGFIQMISYYAAGFNIQTWLEVQSVTYSVLLKGKKSQAQ